MRLITRSLVDETEDLSGSRSKYLHILAHIYVDQPYHRDLWDARHHEEADLQRSGDLATTLATPAHNNLISLG
jgi:hypothetical protein